MTPTPGYPVSTAARVAAMPDTSVVALDVGGIVIPTTRAAGPGNARGYSAADLVRLTLVATLRRAGCHSADMLAALALADGAGDGARLAVLHRGPVVLLGDADELPLNAAEVRVADVRARVAEMLAALEAVGAASVAGAAANDDAEVAP